MHRSFLARGAAVLALALLAACQDNPAAGPREAGGIDPELVRQVEALGFRGDMIEDRGDHFLVEGDVVLPKSRLREMARAASPVDGDDPLRPRFQYSTNALVGVANVSNIRVDLSQIAGSPDWQTATRDAMASWNAVQYSNVRFVEVAGAPADITVQTECRNDGVIGRAVFPAGGGAGNQIVFNLCWIVNGVWTNPTAGQRHYNAAHELGHTVGFRHSNWASRGEPAAPEGANLVPGTPTSDGASVMNGGTATNTWAGFSANDNLAARTLYPLPAAVVTVTNQGGFPLVSWTASGKATSFIVSLVSTREYREPGQRVTVNRQVTPMDTVTASPWQDTTNPFLGISECDWSDPEYAPINRLRYQYEVRTFHAGGGETRGYAPAPIIGQC